ncbi:MAG: PIN domain-containing protein [Planctomycetota bacterium]|nr:PIN domain-containing protein [Planctomycetota bacterium]
MSDCFADTAYFLALVNPDDDAHDAAIEQTLLTTGLIITTSAVLNELGNHLAAPANRPLFLETIERLRADPRAIIHVDARLFGTGLNLYVVRRDKHWSLTDCVSFVLMTERKITKALTTDHHFQQAGFTALLT